MLNHHPLSPILGAEVNGLDLKKPLTTKLLEEVWKLFYHYQVLVFRDQQLSPEEQIILCKQFGDIEPHPLEEVPWKYREITYVTNYNPFTNELFPHCGPPFELWHSDTCYLPVPVKMSFLYAEKVPDIANETLFANMYQAYDDLPNELKQLLNGKYAVFGSGHKLIERCKQRGYDLHITEHDMQPDCIHPVIRTHPVRKKNSIYVNWAHTDAILGMKEVESAALLEQVYKHCLQEKYIYKHTYQERDLIVWDNASTIHSNTAEKLAGIRTMRRIMIKGTKPYYQSCD